VSIGDVLDYYGRYKILHKLGFGGSSTIWDIRATEKFEKLVTLKILSAEQSAKPREELAVPERLGAHPIIMKQPGLRNLRLVKRHFLGIGPNGSHLGLVFQFAGPSIASLSECPGQVSGSKWLRGDLARMVARRVATALNILHSVKVVHGGSSFTGYLVPHGHPFRTLTGFLYRSLRFDALQHPLSDFHRSSQMVGR
jgi:serine/threonine-protein kinase SRPK3